MAEITYEIKKHLFVLSENQKGWKKEVNLVSWNDREPVIDIREWAPNHEKMGKGVTISIEAFREMVETIELGEI